MLSFTEVDPFWDIMSSVHRSCLCKECIYNLYLYNSDLFGRRMWFSVQWRALCTEMTEVNLTAVVYRLFHEDFSSIDGNSLYTYANKSTFVISSHLVFIFCVSQSYLNAAYQERRDIGVKSILQ